MLVFQVSSRTAESVAPPKVKRGLFYQEWFVIVRFVLAVASAGGLFGLLTTFSGSNNAIFLLLPVFVYVAATQFQRYNVNLPFFSFNLFLNSTPSYLFLTICLAFVYYGAITAIELLLHQSPAVTHIILITTALAWTIILDPVRVSAQRYIERRFNLRNRETLRAIESFTATLREEIDLDQLRERFLAVIQRTLQPYTVAFWTRALTAQREPADAPEQITLDDADPLLAYLRRSPGVCQVERLRLDSSALRELKQSGAQLLLPLLSQGELIGLLALGPRLRGNVYTREERSILESLAPQVAPALRVAQMVQEQQEQVRERERIEQELRTAQVIQRTFLPREVPGLDGWRISEYYQPARVVGGDFYDFLSFADGRLGLIIGDVSDKGIPAALVMTATRTMLRTAAQETSAPGEVLARVNDLLLEDIPEGMFVTCFYAILEPASGRLRCANAGHEPPYRRHAGRAGELWVTGMPLGMLPGTRYEERETTLAPGESLLFYSDGLVEAHNAEREMFGLPRLRALLEASADEEALIDVLRRELERFTGEGREQEDDVTLLLLERAPAPVALVES